MSSTMQRQNSLNICAEARTNARMRLTSASFQRVQEVAARSSRSFLKVTTPWSLLSTCSSISTAISIMKLQWRAVRLRPTVWRRCIWSAIHIGHLKVPVRSLSMQRRPHDQSCRPKLEPWSRRWRKRAILHLHRHHLHLHLHLHHLRLRLRLHLHLRLRLRHHLRRHPQSASTKRAVTDCGQNSDLPRTGLSEDEVLGKLFSTCLAYAWERQ